MSCAGRGRERMGRYLHFWEILEERQRRTVD